MDKINAPAKVVVCKVNNNYILLKMISHNRLTNFNKLI